MNLAARIEAHTKVADRAILIDGATRAGMDADVDVEPLGAASFKGVAAPVEVFAVRAGKP